MRYILIIFISFISFSSIAADCLDYQGDYIGSTGRPYTIYYTDQSEDWCNSVIDDRNLFKVSVSEYSELTQGVVSSSDTASSSDLEAILIKLFVFDPELFAIVELALIMAFLTSHFGGRIVRWFGKT